jgi:negative regulator of sigma E activity
MSQNDKESLSALLDNEAGELELRRLLKSYESNPEIAETWERYSLVQALLHEDAVPVSDAFKQRVQQQIAGEAALETPRFTGWQQNLTKIAIAASVAAVFFVAVQTNLNPTPTPEVANQDQTAPTQSALPATALLAENVSVEVDPQAQQLLEEYISRIEIDEEEPPRLEHIQDSPLFRLVNELQAREEQQ